MNAILIVLVPMQEGQPSTEQADTVPGRDIWWWRVGQNNGNADLRKTSSRKEATPPFWTWFIENPRTCGA
jgi:hypothetical protein